MFMLEEPSLHIRLVDQPIDSQALLSLAHRPDCGAVLLFLGTTRAWTDGHSTACLEYDAYRQMAIRSLEGLAQQALTRWRLGRVVIEHRLGMVPVMEASVAIVVSAAHRQAAFEAGQWLIDQLKAEVPIWKKDHTADGDSQWLHPSTSASPNSLVGE
jgi:molybdopterin synthase catalytic subunit